MKTNILIIILLVFFSTTITFSYLAKAQSSDEEILGQFSEDELLELESQIDSIISSPTTSISENTNSGNDFKVDFVWTTDTYIPEDYKGKALPAVRSKVTIRAIAHTKNPEKLQYTWIIEDTSSYGQEGPNLSGTGKDTFGFVTKRIQEYKHKIKVMIQDTETGRESISRFSIQTVLPEVNLYVINNENYNNLAPETLLFRKGDESSLMAKVFYLGAYGINDIDFIWNLYGEKKENDGPKPYILPIKISDNVYTGAYFNLQTEAINKNMSQNIYERAKKTTKIKIIE